MITRWWPIAATLAVAVLLGVHVWRAYTLFMQAVPDPLHEVAAQSMPLNAIAAAATSILFVPDCATGVVVRFDPSSGLRGDVSASFALNEPGGRFPDTPIFTATGKLERMTDGVWTLDPDMQPWRGRFLRMQLRPASDAHGSLLWRAARPARDARPSLDQRWSMRANPIAGSRTSVRDPLQCLTTSAPMPRALALPAAAFLGATWLLTVLVAGWWLTTGR